ncbi:unnamed protein product [Protopolystoma xenopodis]|uniref:non-specific serine/threonine protein kinase n=1 Tax=Protopolystoma xenopodis TaxID=117903 RepID=A0A3S5CL18_9PLAT|nr:unnamed protein product [Protopolystoma xenopodis]
MLRMGFNRQDIHDSLTQQRFNNLTATYLLLGRRRHGSYPPLPGLPGTGTGIYQNATLSSLPASAQTHSHHHQHQHTHLNSHPHTHVHLHSHQHPHPQQQQHSHENQISHHAHICQLHQSTKSQQNQHQQPTPPGFSGPLLSDLSTTGKLTDSGQQPHHFPHPVPGLAGVQHHQQQPNHLPSQQHNQQPATNGEITGVAQSNSMARRGLGTGSTLSSSSSSCSAGAAATPGNVSSSCSTATDATQPPISSSSTSASSSSAAPSSQATASFTEACARLEHLRLRGEVVPGSGGQAQPSHRFTRPGTEPSANGEFRLC